MSWIEKDDGLERNFQFKDFAEAWAFMCRIAAIADAMNHHPEWRNVYNEVSIRLTTHDKGGVTELDHKLAAKIDKILANDKDG